MGQDLSERCHFSHPGREGGSGFWCDLDSYRRMRHTNYVSSFLGNRYMNLFLYKETHFFAFIQFSSLFAQLCYLVAHPVGGYLQTALHMTVLKSGFYTIIPWVVATITDIVIGGWLVDALIRRGYDATRVRKTLFTAGLILGIAVIGAAFTTNANIE